MGYLALPQVQVKTFLSIPGHKHYEICIETGEVRNRRTRHTLAVHWSQSRPGRYYYTCHLGRIHRLLMSAIVGRVLSRSEQVRHLSGDPRDNRLGNLALGTARDNRRDQLASDTYGRKLRTADVRDIRALRGLMSVRQIAAEFGVTPRLIYRIHAGTTWAALS